MQADNVPASSTRRRTTFRSATRNTEYSAKDNLIQDMAEEIRQGAGPNRPAFVEAWVLNWDWGMEMLQEVQKRLGAEFVCVRPDVLIKLRRQASD